MAQYEKHQMMISNILNEFDFERVNKTMVCLDWGWLNKGVPSIDDLRFSARERMDSAIKLCLKDGTPNQLYFSCSGGLKASAMKNDYGQIVFLELEFILTSWDTSDDDLI